MNTVTTEQVAVARAKVFQFLTAHEAEAVLNNWDATMVQTILVLQHQDILLSRYLHDQVCKLVYIGT